MYRIERAAIGSDIINDIRLWDSLAGDCPFRQSSWLRPWWTHFGDNRGLYVLLAKDESGIVCGILPLHCEKNHRGVLKFIGQGSACSDGLSILCAASSAETIGREMGHWLADHANSSDDRWSYLDLDGIISGDRAMIGLSRGLSEGGVWIDIQSRMHTWFKETTGTLEDHLAALGRSRRRTARRLLKQLEQSPELSCELVSCESDLASSLDLMIDLHQRRWNSVGQPGSYAEPTFREFIHAAALEFFRRDRLRLCSLKLHDQIIASSLQMVADDQSLAIYSTGVDLSHAEIEPGNLLNMLTMQHAYANSLPGIDYLRGDEPYKAQLQATPRRIARMLATPPTPRGRIQHTAWRSAFEVTQWIRQRRGRDPIAVLPNLEWLPNMHTQNELMGSE